VRHDADTTGDRRVTVLEAAELLGITPDAVRARLRRGTLRKEQGPDGETVVVLDADTTAHGRATEQPTVAYIAELKARIELLERELADRKEESRRKDHLLAAALERIPPQLEPAREEPPEPREAPLSAPEGPGR
jgi:hypothetical protein